MKKYLIIINLFVFAVSFSQKQELGKVTIEELKEKTHPKDSSAVAAILCRIGETRFNYSENNGLELTTEVITKIKIYKKEGYQYANQGIKFYTGSGNSEKVTISKAVTYNLVDGKIEKSKLNGDGEFIEQINFSWSGKKITMPNVKEGSIIEFKYQISSPYESYIPEWEFQKDIPVNYSEYTTAIPEFYTFNIRNKGYIKPVIETTKKTEKIIFNSKERTGYYNLSTQFSSEKLDFVETWTKYTMQNVPALRDENFVNNLDNYRASVFHELSGRKFPNSGYESFAADWSSVVKTVFENDNFGNELNKTGYFEKDLDAILTGISKEEDKIGIIFNYVKSKMNWNNYNSIYCKDGVRKAYKESKGNASEINLMLVAMLRYASIDTNPVLISTRSNGISVFPSIDSFNYVIAGVELQGKTLLLDATNKNSLPNILPIRDLNWVGRIIRKDGTSEAINLTPNFNSKDVISIMAEINEKGELSGKLKDMYFDYNAFVFRDNYNEIAKESYLEKLEKKHLGLEIDEYIVQNNTDLSKPIIENYSFKNSNCVEIIGDKMYVSPMLFFTAYENPFKQETRQYPVDFTFPSQDKFNINLKIPDGYAVESLPKSANITMPENIGNFKYLISNNGNQIQLAFSKDINKAIIASEHYELIKNFYKELVAKHAEKIILKKI